MYPKGGTSSRGSGGAGTLNIVCVMVQEEESVPAYTADRALTSTPKMY